MTVDELGEIVDKARADGYGNADISVIHASSGNPDQRVSGVQPILSVVYTEGLQLVVSNYLSRYAHVVVPDVEPAR